MLCKQIVKENKRKKIKKPSANYDESFLKKTFVRVLRLFLIIIINMFFFFLFPYNFDRLDEDIKTLILPIYVKHVVLIISN